jgi:hypothetical protein
VAKKNVDYEQNLETKVKGLSGFLEMKKLKKEQDLLKEERIK